MPLCSNDIYNGYFAPADLRCQMLLEAINLSSTKQFGCNLTPQVAYVVYAHLDAKEGDEILITTTPPKHCRWNSLLMMGKCYIQNSKMLETCTLACFVAEILITVQYPSTGLQGLVHPYLAQRNGALKPLFSDTLPLSFIT